jgi:hypothetical protein
VWPCVSFHVLCCPVLVAQIPLITGSVLGRENEASLAVLPDLLAELDGMTPVSGSGHQLANQQG